MDRETMLDRLEYLELERITDLSDSALIEEVSAWFGDGEKTMRRTITLAYLNDYMRWQETKDDQELLESIYEYAKN